MFDNRFIRQESLMGADAMEKLEQAHVAVFGLGGVGSWTCEALARAGIGTLTLIDFDTVSKTNINRQLLALESTINQPKAILAASRILDINPEAQVIPYCIRYSAETRETLLATHYDYIVDAIDLVSCKLDLIESSIQRGIPIISCLGTGNRLHMDGFIISDISKTRDDPLARVVRKELRNRGILHTPVLWANGIAEKPDETEEAPPEGRRSIPGSVSWVPAAAGLKLAEYVVLQLSDLSPQHRTV